jgi:hypothetical protein
MPRTTQDREISSFGSGTAGSVTPYRCVHSCTGALRVNSKASAIAMFCIGAFLLLGAWKIWNGWWCCWLFRASGERSSQPLKVTYTKVPCISKTPTAHVIEC